MLHSVGPLGFSHCVQERLLIAAARLDEILRRGRRAVGFEGGGVACEGGDPGSSSACIASKVIAGMHPNRVAIAGSSSRRELAGAREPIQCALRHLAGTGPLVFRGLGRLPGPGYGGFSDGDCVRVRGLHSG